MFKKLRKKIFIGIVTVALLFTLVSGGVSYAVILRNVFTMHTSRVSQNAVNGAKGCHSYVDAVQGFVNAVSAKQQLAQAIESGVYESEVKQLLNGFYNYAVSVDGVTLYGKGNYISFSSGMGVVPSFADLLNVQEIADFWQSDENSFVSVRTKAIAGVYGSQSYDANCGVLSCMSKVYDDSHQPIGLLVADVLPATLYKVKLSYNVHNTPCTAFIVDESGAVYTDSSLAEYAFTKGVSADFKYFITDTQLFDGVKIVMIAPLSEYVGYCFTLGVVIFAVIALLMFGVVLVAKSIANRVSSPLERLAQQIKDDERKLTNS